MDILIPVKPKIARELTRESLININQLISWNAASMASNFGGVQPSHLTLTIPTEDYLAHMGHTLITPHNTVNFPKVIETENFQQNQAFFECCTTIDRAIKK